jgi:hypothetical protein
LFVLASSLACGTKHETTNVVTSPVAGTYTGCARGIASEGPISGFEGSASLTIAGSDSDVTATYTDENGVKSTFDLAASAAATAELTSNASVTGYGYGLCAGSSSHGLPTLPESYPATLTAMDGALMTTSGTAILAATGTLAGVDGSGSCSLSTPETYWIVCSDGPTSGAPTSSTGSGFPTGTYSCVSAVDVAQHDPVAHADQNSSGTMTLESSTTGVEVRYNNDVYLSGKLQFAVTSATSAVAVAGQSLDSVCTDYSQVPPAQLVSNTFPVTTASLLVVGSTIFLSYTGAAAESTGGSGSATTTCPAASLVGTVICTMGSGS